MKGNQSKRLGANQAAKADGETSVLENVDVSTYSNEWGPSHVVQVYDPVGKVKGILVIDNVNLGPGCGGIQISPSATPYETFHMARFMTLSHALLDLRFGGAAASIVANPFEIDKTHVVRFLARGVSPYVPDLYVAAPGLNVGQNEMKMFAEEVGDRQGATGKPLDMEGIPHELGVIGLGMGVAIETTVETVQPSATIPSDVSKARISLQGYGNISYTAAKYLSNKGAEIVALSDDRHAIKDDDGIDMESLPKSFSGGAGHSLGHCKGLKKLPKEAITSVDCDILVLTVDDRSITKEDVRGIKAKLIVEGLNLRISGPAEEMLDERGALIIPGILATAGAPISSHAEYNGISRERAFSLIESQIRGCTKEVVQHSLEVDKPLRKTVKEIAEKRITLAKEVE